MADSSPISSVRLTLETMTFRRNSPGDLLVKRKWPSSLTVKTLIAPCCAKICGCRSRGVVRGSLPLCAGFGSSTNQSIAVALLADLVDTEFEAILRLLVEGKVDFILIGGLAAVGHGLARATYDVDIVYSRSSDNIEQVVKALTPTEPYLRGAPPGLPFRFDQKTVQMGLNFTL